MGKELRATEALRELNAALENPISYNVFWRMITEGRIPAHRLGREWRINKVDLEPLSRKLNARVP